MIVRFIGSILISDPGRDMFLKSVVIVEHNRRDSWLCSKQTTFPSNAKIFDKFPVLNIISLYRWSVNSTHILFTLGDRFGRRS